MDDEQSREVFDTGLKKIRHENKKPLGASWPLWNHYGRRQWPGGSPPGRLENRAPREGQNRRKIV